MDMDREAKKIRFASFRHSMLCKVVACLLTLIFTFENATYGYEQRPKYESRSNLRTVRDIESLCPARMAAISGFQTIVADGIEPAENLLRLSQAPAIRFPSGKYLVWEETRRERDTFSEAKENALELSEVLRALISEGKWPHEVFKPITSTPAAVVDSKRVDEISPAAPAANETEKQQAVAPDTVTSSDEGERPQLKEDGTSKKGEPKPDEFDLGRPGDDIAWREAEAAQKAAKDEISFVGKIFKVISCYFEEHKLAMVFATATLKAMGCVTVGLVAQLTGSLQLIFWVYFADLLWAFLVFMPLLGTYKIRGGNVFTVYREAYVTWKRLNGLHKLCLVVFSTVALVASCGFYYVLPHVTPSMMLVLVQLNLLTGLPLTYKLLNEKSGWKRKGAGITVLASSILLMIFTEWLVNPAFFSNLSWIGWGALVGALWGIPGVLIRKIFKDAQTEDGDGRLLYGEDTERVLSFLPMVIIGFNYLTTAGLLFIIIKCSGISLLTFNGMSIFNPFIASAIGIAAFFFVTVWFFSWKLSRMVKYDLSKIGPGVSSTSMIATLMSALSGGSPFASPYSLIAPVGVIAGSYIAASGGNADDREESAELIPGSPMPNIPEIVREALTNNPGISFGTLIEEVKKDLPVPLGSTMEDVYPDLESRVIECLDEDDIGVSPTGPSPKGSAAYCFKSLGSAPKTISELANYSGRAESTIRETIRTLIKLNLVRKMGNKYGLNNRIPGLKNPKAQDEIYKYLSRLPHRWRIYAFQRPYIKGRITKIIKKYSEIEKGIKKLKQRLIKRFYLDDKKEIAQINKIIDQWVDAYGADSVLELGGLDLKLLKVLIFERKVRNLLHKFGMRTFLRIARLKVKDAEEVMSNVAVFTSPKSSRQLLFYVRAFAKINSYLGNYLMARREKHVPIFRHIIAKHGIGVLVRLVETVGYKVFYFFEYRLDGYDTVRNEEMMEFLDRIKDSKKDVLDLIRILEFIKEPYSGRKIRDSLIFVTNAFMDNLLHLLKGSRPGEVLKFLKAMGSKEAGIFLSRMHDYLKGLIEEHGIEPITEIARAAGKDGAGWHRAIYENLRVVVDEFGFQILPTIAKKAKGSTEAMFRGGVHLAMRYIERDKKDRREKFLRYALALAGEVRKVDNSKAGVILSDHAGIFEKMVVRKGKNPAELEVELSEWARFLVKMTVGADEYREGIYLLKISLVLPLIERFGKEPFLKIARTYPGKAGDILNGIYILSEFIKTKEDISYYAEKVDKIEGGVSKPGAIDALGHVLPLIRKFGIDRVIEISRVVKGYTRAVFKEILPAIMDLIEDEEDFDKLIVVLKALKRDLKKRLYTVFISGIPQISCFLKSIEDLEDYRPALVKIVRVSNDNAIYVIIRSIGLFEERIHSKEDLLNHILPVARIAEYSRDYADTIFDEHLPYMIGVEPDAVHKICALIDNKIPEDSAPDVSSRYAQSIVLSIAVLSSLGINGFGMVEYLLKKKRSFALSELAEYIYITPRYLNGHLKDTAGFINSLPDSNAKFELTRMVLKRIEMFRCRDREPEATSSETKKFFKGLNTVARLEGDEILMNLLKLNLDKMNGAIDELPLKKRDLERLKRFIRTGGLRKAYKGIIEAALNDKPDFKKIWSLIEAYNRKVKALIDSIKRRPEVKVLYEKIDDLNREMGNLRRDIQTAKRGGHIRKAGKLGKNLEKVLGELRQLYKAAKGIDKIRNLLSVPFQSLINKQRTETNLEEYKEDLRKIMTDAKIQIIRMFMIRIRNRIYEAILGKPIFKEIEGSYMLDRVASICYGMMLSGEVTGRRLADLLKLYIEGETPDKIRRYVYTEDVKKKLEEAGYNPSPFIEGCSMKYDASTASDFILRKEERLRNHIIELQGHIRGLGLDVKELDISQDPQSIYKMLIEQLREKQVDLAALESMLNDIKIHLDAIKSIQAETQKKGEAEQVEFYISLDPVEEMYMGVGFASCLDIEREVAESPLGVGLSWDKLVAYVKNEKGNRIARRLLVITDKGIVVFNQHFNTQLDLDYGWVKFLQKLADETGKDVIVPRREKVSSSFKKVLDRSGIETVRNLRCKILQREYASYLYDDLGIRKDYTLVIGSGYRITPKPVKKEKKPVLPKKAEQKESYRFLTDPIYRAALANSMSSLIVKAHDLGIKTVLACGISAQPACQFFRLCWERIYPDEEPPRIEFIGEAAGQVSEERYDKEGVISKISSFGKLEAPILILDDIYATGMTMGLTKKLLADHFEDREVYTAALFRLGEIVVDKPDLPAPEIKENVYKLGSNWYLTRLHTLRPKGTLTYKVSKKKLKQIFEEDLPHDLELLSHKVYERVMRQTKPPAAEQDEEESDGPQILPGSPMPNIPEIVREALTNNPGISFGTLIEEVKKDLPVPLGSTMEDVYPDLESIVTECLDEDNIANMMISAEGEPEFFSFAAALARRGTNKAIDNLKWVYQHRVAFEKKLLIVEALSETSNKRAISFLEEALRDGFTTSLDSIFSILQKQEALFGEEVAELLAEYKDSSLYAYLDIRAKAELHAKAALPDLISMAQNATAAERRIIFEAINATMKLPFSIVCDEAGKIYIVKRGNNFSSTKELLSEIALTSDSYPVGIDIGSGRGDFVPAMQEILKEVYPSAAFIGNERGSDEFDDNLGRLGIFFVGDAENLPIKDKAVQIATINNSFREKSGDYIKEAARILDRDGVLLFLPYCLWNNFRGQFVRQMLESGFTVEEVRLPEDYPRSRDYVDNGLLLIARRLDTSDELCTRRIEDLTFLLEYVQSQVVLEDKGTTEPLLSQPLKGTGDGSENTAPPSGPIGIPKGSPAHIFEMLCLQIQPLTMGEIARLKVVDRAVQTIEKDVQSLVYLGLAKKVPKEGKTAYKIITLNKREKAQVMSLLRQLGYRAYTRDLKKVEAPIGEIVKEALSRIEPKEINVHPITLRLAIILRLAKDGVMPMAGKGDFYAKDIKVIDDIASELTDVYYTSAFIRTITKVKKTQYFRLLRRLGIRRIETEDEVYLRREDAIYFASWVRLKKRYTIPRKKAKELLGVTSVAAIYALKQKIPDMVLTINRVEYLSREAVMREVKRRDVSRLIPPGYISVDELQKMLQKEFPGINKVTLDYLLRTRNEIDAIKIFNPVNKTEWNYVSIKDIEKIKAAIRGMRGAPYVQVLQIGDIRDEALYPTKTAKAVTGLPYHIFTTGVRKRRLEGVPGGKGGITTLIKGRSIKLVYALQNEDFKKHIRLLKRLKRMIEDGRLTRKDLRRDPAALKDEIDNAIMVLLNLAQVRRDEVDAGEIESSMAELQLDEETIKRYLKLPYGEVKGKAGKRIRRMPAEYEGLSLCRPEDIVDSPLLKEAPFTFEPESAYYRIQDVIDQLQIDAKMLKALIDRKILPVNEDGLIRASDFELIKEVVKNLTHDLYSLDSIAVLLDISRSTLNDLLKIEKITSRRIGIKAYVSKEDAAFLVIRKRLIDKHLFARKRAAEVLGVKPKSVGLLIWKKRLRTVMIGKVKHVTKESVYGRLHARTLPDGCISLPELLEEIKTKPLFSSVDYSTVRYAASQLRILKTGVDKRSKVRIVYVPRDKIDRVMDFIKKHSPAVRDLLSIKDIEDDEYYPIEVARVLTGLPAKTINYQLTKGNIEGVRPPGMLKHVLIKGSSIKGLYRTREPYWEALKKGKVYPAAEIAERVGVEDAGKIDAALSRCKKRKTRDGLYEYRMEEVWIPVLVDHTGEKRLSEEGLKLFKSVYKISPKKAGKILDEIGPKIEERVPDEDLIEEIGAMVSILRRANFDKKALSEKLFKLLMATRRKNKELRLYLLRLLHRYSAKEEFEAFLERFLTTIHKGDTAILDLIEELKGLPALRMLVKEAKKSLSKEEYADVFDALERFDELAQSIDYKGPLRTRMDSIYEAASKGLKEELRRERRERGVLNPNALDMDLPEAEEAAWREAEAARKKKEGEVPQTLVNFFFSRFRERSEAKRPLNPQEFCPAAKKAVNDALKHGLSTWRLGNKGIYNKAGSVVSYKKNRRSLVDMIFGFARPDFLKERLIILLPPGDNTTSKLSSVEVFKTVSMVVFDLLQNAGKYGKNRSIILIIKPFGVGLHIEVVDQGIGIPPDEVSSIPGKYFRASNVTKTYRGTGMALWRAKERIHKLGGKIKIRSKLDKWTKVSIDLSDALKPEVYGIAAKITNVGKKTKGSPAQLLEMLKDKDNTELFQKALDKEKGITAAEVAEKRPYVRRTVDSEFEVLKALGIFVPVEGRPYHYRFSDMMIGPDSNYTKTMINAITDIRYQVGKKGEARPLHRYDIPEDKRLVVRELVKMAIIHQVNLMCRPSIPEDKVLWHLLENSLLGVQGASPNSSFGEGVLRRHQQANLIIEAFPKKIIKKGSVYKTRPWEEPLSKDLDSENAEKISRVIEMLEALGGTDPVMAERVRVLKEETTIIEVDVPSHLLLYGKDMTGEIFYQLTHIGVERNVIYVPKKFLEDLDELRILAGILNHDQQEILEHSRILEGGGEVSPEMEEEIHAKAVEDDPFGIYPEIEGIIKGYADGFTEAMIQDRIGELKREITVKKRKFNLLQIKAKFTYVDLRFYLNDLALLYTKLGCFYDIREMRKEAIRYYRSGIRRLRQIENIDKMKGRQIGTLPFTIQIRIIYLLARERLLKDLIREFKDFVIIKDEAISTRRDQLLPSIAAAITDILKHHLKDETEGDKIQELEETIDAVNRLAGLDEERPKPSALDMDLPEAEEAAWREAEDARRSSGATAIVMAKKARFYAMRIARFVREKREMRFIIGLVRYVRELLYKEEDDEGKRGALPSVNTMIEMAKRTPTSRLIEASSLSLDAIEEAEAELKKAEEAVIPPLLEELKVLTERIERAVIVGACDLDYLMDNLNEIQRLIDFLTELKADEDTIEAAKKMQRTAVYEIAKHKDMRQILAQAQREAASKDREAVGQAIWDEFKKRGRLYHLSNLDDEIYNIFASIAIANADVYAREGTSGKAVDEDKPETDFTAPDMDLPEAESEIDKKGTPSKREKFWWKVAKHGAALSASLTLVIFTGWRLWWFFLHHRRPLPFGLEKCIEDFGWLQKINQFYVNDVLVIPVFVGYWYLLYYVSSLLIPSMRDPEMIAHARENMKSMAFIGALFGLAVEVTEYFDSSIGCFSLVDIGIYLAMATFFIRFLINHLPFIGDDILQDEHDRPSAQTPPDRPATPSQRPKDVHPRGVHDEGPPASLPEAESEINPEDTTPQSGQIGIPLILSFVEYAATIEDAAKRREYIEGTEDQLGIIGQIAESIKADDFTEKEIGRALAELAAAKPECAEVCAEVVEGVNKDNAFIIRLSAAEPDEEDLKTKRITDEIARKAQENEKTRRYRERLENAAEEIWDNTENGSACFNLAFYLKRLLKERYKIGSYVRVAYIRKPEGESFVHYWVETKDGWMIDIVVEGNPLVRSIEAFRGRRWVVIGPDETRFRQYYLTAVTTNVRPRIEPEASHTVKVMLPPQLSKLTNGESVIEFSPDTPERIIERLIQQFPQLRNRIPSKDKYSEDFVIRVDGHRWNRAEVDVRVWEEIAIVPIVSVETMLPAAEPTAEGGITRFRDRDSDRGPDGDGHSLATKMLLKKNTIISRILFAFAFGFYLVVKQGLPLSWTTAIFVFIFGYPILYDLFVEGRFFKRTSDMSLADAQDWVDDYVKKHPEYFKGTNVGEVLVAEPGSIPGRISEYSPYSKKLRISLDLFRPERFLEFRFRSLYRHENKEASVKIGSHSFKDFFGRLYEYSTDIPFLKYILMPIMFLLALTASYFTKGPVKLFDFIIRSAPEEERPSYKRIFLGFYVIELAVTYFKPIIYTESFLLISRGYIWQGFLTLISMSIAGGAARALTIFYYYMKAAIKKKPMSIPYQFYSYTVVPYAGIIFGPIRSVLGLDLLKAWRVRRLNKWIEGLILKSTTLRVRIRRGVDKFSYDLAQAAFQYELKKGIRFEAFADVSECLAKPEILDEALQRRPVLFLGTRKAIRELCRLPIIQNNLSEDVCFLELNKPEKIFSMAQADRWQAIISSTELMPDAAAEPDVEAEAPTGEADEKEPAATDDRDEKAAQAKAEEGDAVVVPSGPSLSAPTPAELDRIISADRAERARYYDRPDRRSKADLHYFRPIVRELLREYGSLENMKGLCGLELGPKTDTLALFTFLREKGIRVRAIGDEIGRDTVYPPFLEDDPAALHRVKDYNDYLSQCEAASLDFIYAPLSLYITFRDPDSGDRKTYLDLERRDAVRKRYIPLCRALRPGGIIIRIEYSGEFFGFGKLSGESSLLKEHELAEIGLERIMIYTEEITRGTSTFEVTVEVLRREMNVDAEGALEADILHETGNAFQPEAETASVTDWRVRKRKRSESVPEDAKEPPADLLGDLDDPMEEIKAHQEAEKARAQAAQARGEEDKTAKEKHSYIASDEEFQGRIIEYSKRRLAGEDLEGSKFEGDIFSYQIKRRFVGFALKGLRWVPERLREELEDEAQVQLLRAIRMYDYQRGAKFITYAKIHVDGNLLTYIRDHIDPIHIPAHIKAEIYIYTRTRDTLYKRLGVGPTFEEVMAAIEKEGTALEYPEYVRQALELGSVLSLDYRSDESDEFVLGDTVPGPLSTEDEAILKFTVDELAERLLPALFALSREEVILWRYIDEFGVRLPVRRDANMGMFFLEHFGIGTAKGTPYKRQWVNVAATRGRERFTHVVSILQRHKKESWEYTTDEYSLALAAAFDHYEALYQKYLRRESAIGEIPSPFTEAHLWALSPPERFIIETVFDVRRGGEKGKMTHQEIAENICKKLGYPSRNRAYDASTISILKQRAIKRLGTGKTGFDFLADDVGVPADAITQEIVWGLRSVDWEILKREYGIGTQKVGVRHHGAHRRIAEELNALGIKNPYGKPIREYYIGEIKMRALAELREGRTGRMRLAGELGIKPEKITDALLLTLKEKEEAVIRHYYGIGVQRTTHQEEMFEVFKEKGIVLSEPQDVARIRYEAIQRLEEGGEGLEHLAADLSLEVKDLSEGRFEILIPEELRAVQLRYGIRTRRVKKITAIAVIMADETKKKFTRGMVYARLEAAERKLTRWKAQWEALKANMMAQRTARLERTETPQQEELEEGKSIDAVWLTLRPVEQAVVGLYFGIYGWSYIRDFDEISRRLLEARIGYSVKGYNAQGILRIRKAGIAKLRQAKTGLELLSEDVGIPVNRLAEAMRALLTDDAHTVLKLTYGIDLSRAEPDSDIVDILNEGNTGQCTEQNVRDMRFRSLTALRRFAVRSGFATSEILDRRKKIILHRKARQVKWTREVILETVARLAREGKDVNTKGIAKMGLKSMLNSAVKLFGSWDTVLLETGLDPARIKKKQKVHLSWAPLRDRAREIWPDDHIVEKDEEVAGMNFPTVLGDHYLIVAGFLFIDEAEWKRHSEEFGEHKDSVIVCSLKRSELSGRLDFLYGAHTRLAILLLRARSYLIKDEVILDAGSGDGILAMVASRIGAKKVIAIEHNKEWVQTSRRLLKLNNINVVDVIEKGFADIQKIKSAKSAAVVVANLKDNGIYKEGEHFKNWHFFLMEKVDPQWYFLCGAVDDKTGMLEWVKEGMEYAGCTICLEERLEGARHIPVAVVLQKTGIDIDRDGSGDDPKPVPPSRDSEDPPPTLEGLDLDDPEAERVSHKIAAQARAEAEGSNRFIINGKVGLIKGLHFRPATYMQDIYDEIWPESKGKIAVRIVRISPNPTEEAECSSFIELLGLTLKKDNEFRIIVEGPYPESILESVGRVFEEILLADVVEDNIRIKNYFMDKAREVAKVIYNRELAVSQAVDDAEFTMELLIDILHRQIPNGTRRYEIRYDRARLSEAQIEIVEEYIRLLQSMAATEDSIKGIPFDSTVSRSGREYPVISVVCRSGPDIIGEGHIDLPEEGDAHLLRVLAAMNMAFALASLPKHITPNDIADGVDKYRRLIAFIQRQYKAISNRKLLPEEILNTDRVILLDLPEADKIKYERIDLYNKKAIELLSAV